MLISTASAKVLINFGLCRSSSLRTSRKSLTPFCKPQLENYLWKTSHSKYSKKTFQHLILLRKLSLALIINVFMEGCKDICRVINPKAGHKGQRQRELCGRHSFLLASLCVGLDSLHIETLRDARRDVFSEIAYHIIRLTCFLCV